MKVQPSFFCLQLVAQQDVKLFSHPHPLKLKLLQLFINERFNCKINSFSLLKLVAIAHS